MGVVGVAVTKFIKNKFCDSEKKYAVNRKQLRDKD